MNYHVVLIPWIFIFLLDLYAWKEERKNNPGHDLLVFWKVIKSTKFIHLFYVVFSVSYTIFSTL